MTSTVDAQKTDEAANAAAAAEQSAQLRSARRTGRPPLADRREIGRRARQAVPRAAHGDWKPVADRPDPIALLRKEDQDRVPELVPIRHGRMSASPFAFYRGAAGAMAADLAPLPATGLTTQLCGDAHVSNFGLFGAPDRSLLFDVNDFDETLPGPFEWDVKRLAASAVVAVRETGLPEAVGREAALAAVRSYREHMAEFAEMSELEVWYTRVSSDDLLQRIRSLSGKTARKVAERAQAAEAKARSRTSLHALRKLTISVNGQPQIIDAPPLIMRVPVEQEELRRVLRQGFLDYKRSLADDRRVLVQRFSMVDVAFKVVGVGSVGTRCFIALLTGRDDDDPLFLQIKEAGPSVLERHLGRSRFANAGHRVVAGQQLMQAASDIFLGWMRATGPDRRPFYFRQLRDMKGSFEGPGTRQGVTAYCALCGWVLARAHARAGDPLAISAYLGKGDRFDLALADFAKAYADQTERDFELLTKAIAAGKVPAEKGI